MITKKVVLFNFSLTIFFEINSPQDELPFKNCTQYFNNFFCTTNISLTHPQGSDVAVAR